MKTYNTWSIKRKEPIFIFVSWPHSSAKQLKGKQLTWWRDLDWSHSEGINILACLSAFYLELEARSQVWEYIDLWFEIQLKRKYQVKNALLERITLNRSFMVYNQMSGGLLESKGAHVLANSTTWINGWNWTPTHVSIDLAVQKFSFFSYSSGTLPHPSLPKESCPPPLLPHGPLIPTVVMYVWGPNFSESNNVFAVRRLTSIQVTFRLL